MSTRVLKGGTVFRPVAKVRPRAAENSPAPRSVSRDVLASHPLPEIHQAPLSLPIKEISTVFTSAPSTIPSQFSLQDHAPPPVVANTARIGVPIVVSSSRATPTAQSAEPLLFPPEETSSSLGPSQIDVSVVEQSPLHQSKKRSRSESLAVSKKYRKLRQNTTPTFTTGADPGEDLDPTSITMAALCEDTGQGRVSNKAAQILDNHLAWKRSNREKRARMRVRMEARKYGRNEDNDTTQGRPVATESQQISAADATPGSSSILPVSENLHTVQDASGQGFDYSEDVSTSRYSVQVRIGPNGETIVDEESLFVDRNVEEDATEYTHVEESDVSKFVNSATYSRRFRGSRWSVEETELFYDALSQFGENYELISYVLPGRDRKACKNKFKTEDKKNAQRINYCLNNRKPYDMQTLSRMTGKDFSGPTPEIRAPATLSLVGTQETNHPPVPGQITIPPSTAAEQVEEVVGNISSFDPE